jgi:hypothetical protein
MERWNENRLGLLGVYCGKCIGCASRYNHTMNQGGVNHGDRSVVNRRLASDFSGTLAPVVRASLDARPAYTLNLRTSREDSSPLHAHVTLARREIKPSNRCLMKQLRMLLKPGRVPSFPLPFVLLGFGFNSSAVSGATSAGDNTPAPTDQTRSGILPGEITYPGPGNCDWRLGNPVPASCSATLSGGPTNGGRSPLRRI